MGLEPSQRPVTVPLQGLPGRGEASVPNAVT